jgi:hypothetical protein
MRYLIPLLLAACASSPQKASVTPAPQCDNRWSEMRPHVARGWSVVDLTPAQVEHFVAGVNREPPETSYTADEVHITSKPGAPIAYAYFVTDGCVEHAIQVPSELIPALIAGPGTRL